MREYDITLKSILTRLGGERPQGNYGFRRGTLA
jgi:hypothetical protein